MKYLLLAALLAVSACATAPTGERGPARPLNCAYADSHCAHGEMCHACPQGRLDHAAG